jgi:hypothetical protein
MKINKIFFCLTVAALSIGTAAYLEFIHYKFIPPYPPLSWGIPSETISLILTIIFPWNARIFLLPLFFLVFFRLGIRTLMYLWIGSFFAMGILDTVVSFDVVSFSRLVKGILHYAILYGFFVVPVVGITYFSQKDVETGLEH